MFVSIHRNSANVNVYVREDSIKKNLKNFVRKDRGGDKPWNANKEHNIFFL